MENTDLEPPPYHISNCPGRGRGVYSNIAYRANEFVMEFTGDVTPIWEINDFTHYLQIAPDLFLGPSGGADDYVNHSCDPNCALYFENDTLVLRTIRKIKAGQELSFDYGTIQFSEPTTFKCECGSRRCRGMVGSFYLLSPDLREYYLAKNMIPLLTRYALEELETARSIHPVS